MNTVAAPERPFALTLRSSNKFILATICLAAFTDGFLYGVVVPVLPFSLGDQSGVPEEDIQKWTSYLLMIFGGAALLTSRKYIWATLAGWIADQGSTRRLPFLVGLFIQALATSLLLVTPGVKALMIARALQGLSAAVVYAVGMAILVDTFGMDDVGKNAGYFLSSANIGVLISPPIGGFVYARVGYWAVVALMVSLVVLDIVLRLAMIEKSIAAGFEEEDEEADIYRAILSFPTSYGALSIYRSQYQDILKKKMPAFVSILRDPRGLANIYAVFICYVILAAFDAGLGVFVKGHFHWHSSAAGTLFVAIALPSLLYPVAGSLSDKYGPKWIATGGFGIAAAAAFAIGFIQNPTLWQMTSLYALLCVIGTGIAFVLPSIANDLTAIANKLSSPSIDTSTSRGAYAQAFGLFNCGITGGTVVGPFLMSFVSQFGWQVVTVFLGILASSACASILVSHVEARGDKARPGEQSLGRPRRDSVAQYRRQPIGEGRRYNSWQPRRQSVAQQRRQTIGDVRAYSSWQPRRQSVT
ncbi:major facilitator superfamily domain-containing protein [Clohesyomyces aquaticus]|uniref:Major facilitator superfamily domain-containing protein n=1 Tax=Clohesyomyces aquaticus TaxID=1231657 RepID=A0A1Y2A321_9PLEO|nr:major facilitator superfamily domain-containing protein [Clohesyomyces aquaticus]